MRFGVLGPLAVWTVEGHPVEIPERKVRALLTDLVVHEGRPISTDQLIDDLWGDERPSDPAAALRTKVSQLRRALESAEPGGRGLVVHEKSGYALQTGDDAIDAATFTKLVARAQRTVDLRTRVALLTDALDLWRGPALADFADAAFTRSVSDRWTEQRLTALEERAEARLELDEHHDLTAVLPELIREHPLRERLRSVYMRALYRAGRQGDALRCYGDLRTRLVEELGVDPSPELAALHLAILEHDPSLGSPPPDPGRDGLCGNLPAASLTTLVGRDDAVAEVRSLVGTNRLVTLTGPGGVGKTRLALEVGAQLETTVAGGVWLVELAGLADADTDAVDTVREASSEADVAYAVANALGLREPTVTAPSGAVHDDGDRHTGEHTAIDRLVEAITDRTCLIILDNCEHVIGPAAMLTDRLLKAAPGLQILATSRQAQRISGEMLWTVPPLALPDEETPADALAVEQPAAVRLFSARAAAAAPGFVLDAATGPWVAIICRRLDGIPLALELAATRVRALGVEELAARLDDRFRLLGRGSRDAATRHQTLEAMIDWSWQRLTIAQQAVLRRVAVSADGYDLDAAEHICAGADVDAADVLDILTELVDRSLVVVDARHPRYSLLESIAAYCLDRLAETGELPDVRERHDHYFTDLAERANTGLRGPSQRQWLQRLDVESNNLREALDGAIHRGDPGLALRLVNAMAWFWYLRGRFSDAHRSLTRAVTAGGDGPPAARAEAAALHAGFSRWADRDVRLRGTPIEVLAPFDDLDEPARRARAQWFLTLTDFSVNHAATGGTLVESALATFTELGDQWGVAACLALRADRAFVLRGELTEARHDAERAVAMFHELGDRWGEMQGLEVLNPLAEISGDYDEARTLASAMLHIAEDLDSPAAVSYALSRLGRIALLTGDHTTAKDLHGRALQVAVQQSDWIGEEFAEIGLALGARRAGRLDEAEEYLTRRMPRLREQGSNIGLSFLMTELGFVAELRGDSDLALTRQLEASAAALTTGEPRAIALAFEGLAGALGLHERGHEAARCLGAAGAARASVGAPLPPAECGDVDRITGRLRTILAEPSLRSELEYGATRDQAALFDEIRAVGTCPT